ncbi:hypothetical protein ACJJIE_07145 [Microbulbifer sp. TRSA001]|uniref:hypothetical protein n=1 Tax=Microbulbifer sp. TRSA001 TaxID=3243381 RepID=UPI004039DBAD
MSVSSKDIILAICAVLLSVPISLNQSEEPKLLLSLAIEIQRVADEIVFSGIPEITYKQGYQYRARDTLSSRKYDADVI